MTAPKGTMNDPIERAEVRLEAVSRWESSRRREDMVSSVVS